MAKPKHERHVPYENPNARMKRIEWWLERIDWFLRVLLIRNERQGVQLMGTLQEYQAELQKLTAEVTRNTDVDTSANVLLTSLTAKIQELIDNGGGADIPIAELQALNDAIKASTDSLASGVAANTPADV